MYLGLTEIIMFKRKKKVATWPRGEENGGILFLTMGLQLYLFHFLSLLMTE